MRHHIHCPRHKKPLEIYDSRNFVSPPIAKLLYTCSLERCHQRLLLFSFLENQLSSSIWYKEVLEPPIFIERQCRLASWIRNFKHIPIRIKHCIPMIMCYPNIRLSMLHDLINLPIAYLTIQFCAELIWHVSCGWAFTIGKPISKYLPMTFPVTCGLWLVRCSEPHVWYLS